MGNIALGVLDPREELLRSKFGSADLKLVQLHLLLRLLQRSNQFLFRNPATGLTNLETMLILEVDSHAETSAQSLISLFGVDQSTMSRSIQNCVKKALITQRASTTDARQKILTIAKKGRSLLKAHDAHANKIIDRYLERVSATEMKSVVELFKAIADDFKVPAAISRPSEHPIRAQMRRITFALGLTRSESYYNSSVSMLGWQVLCEIFLRGECASIALLAGELSMPPLNLSQLIGRLQKAKLITTLPSYSDQRATRFICSENGIKKISEILENSASEFNKILSSGTKRAISAALPEIEKLIGYNYLGDTLIEGKIGASKINGERRLTQARSIIISDYYSKGTLLNLHHQIASPSATVVSLVKDGLIVGVIEGVVSAKNIEILHVALEPQIKLTKSELETLLMKMA